MSSPQTAVQPLAASSHHAQIVPLWCFMTLISASAAILTRYCHLPAATIGFWRVFGAGTVLLPWFILTARQVRPTPLISRGALLTGLVFGLHFATWAWALLNAKVANAALFIAMQPAITPYLGHLVSRDRLNMKEYIGTALTCAGMICVLGAQIAFERDQLAGSLVSLFSMVCCALYLVLTRKFRSGQHVILFSVPLYFSAAALQLIPALLSQKIFPTTTSAWFAIAAIILFPTVGGHTIAMYLLRRTKAHTIALSIPVQFLVIAIAGWFLFSERPAIWFYPGAAMVLIGVIIAILSAKPPSIPSTPSACSIPPVPPAPQP